MATVYLPTSAFHPKLFIPLVRNLWKQLSREAVIRGSFFLPEERRIQLERYLRGKEEARRLRRCDAVIVSYGKSGRTWLRVMLSRYYCRKHDLGDYILLGFDNLYWRCPEIPKIFFTHDNYLKDYTGHTADKRDYYDRRVVLLVRDPRDVAVSQYFQWRYRMRPQKKKLNRYPPHGAEVPIFDFVMNPDCGLPKIIDFMNLWAKEWDKISEFLLVRYEDLRRDTFGEMKGILEFLGTPGRDELIRDAVEFASVENMRKLEQQKVFWLSGSRLVPKDKNNPNAYKVRRAKVEGWRDYFTQEQGGVIDRFVRDNLDPRYGYTGGDHA